VLVVGKAAAVVFVLIPSISLVAPLLQFRQSPVSLSTRIEVALITSTTPFSAPAVFDIGLA